MSGIKAKVANGYRIGWGLFFLGSAVFNALVTLPNSEKVLEAFEGMSIPGADALLRALMPYAAGLSAAVVAFEALVGVLILSKDKRARLGLGASIAWVVCLMTGMRLTASTMLTVPYQPKVAGASRAS